MIILSKDPPVSLRVSDRDQISITEKESFQCTALEKNVLVHVGELLTLWMSKNQSIQIYYHVNLINMII